MLWLGGFPVLDITTRTPDALCPPIEEARAAIQARVGEVRGNYHVEFALVRGVDGRQVLELTVHEAQKQVLARELPLDAAGCEDAAQAIALVLERYFDAVEKPAPVSKPALTTISSSEQPLQNSPPAVASEPSEPREPSEPSETSANSRWRAWRARAGFIYDLQLGVAPSLGAVHFPEVLRLTPRLQLGVALDVAPFLRHVEQNVREQEISAFSVQTALSMPLVWHFEPWSASFGPWAQLRIQRAEGKSLTHQQRAYRAVPGFGATTQLAWSPASRWTLGLGVAAGGQATTATSRFILRTADDESRPVLVPDAWFAQGQLTLAVEL
jgi:hypothetical protein